MRRRFFASTAIFSFVLFSGLSLGAPTHVRAEEQLAGLPAAEGFALPDLVGPWYEIARIGHVMNAVCGDATATFAVGDKDADKSLQATFARTCPVGGLASISAELHQTDPSVPSRLTLRYLETLGHDHFINVIAQDPKAQWIVMADDERESLYIYSKSPKLDAPTLTRMVADAQVIWGFDNAQQRMSCTPQEAAAHIDGPDCLSVIGH